MTESQHNTSPTASRAANGAASAGAGETSYGKIFIATGEPSAGPNEAGSESGQSSSGGDNTEDERSQKSRPVGNKRAVALKEQNAAMENGSQGLLALAESSKKNAKLAEDALAIEMDKVESLKIQTHLKLFKMTEDTEDAKQCLSIMRKKILSSLQNSEEVAASAPQTGTMNLGNGSDAVRVIKM